MEPTVVDSAAVYSWVTTTLPGINPGFVMMIAGILASRALWAVKLVATIASKLQGETVIVQGLRSVWSKVAWIVNPILMVMMGWIATGGDLGLGTLIGFAGMGVREWLVKSPIPTSKEGLAKLKGAF
jgi:hypothetical protein